MADIIHSACLNARDLADRLAFLLLTHMPTTIPEIWALVQQLLAIIAGKALYADDSRKPGYNFHAVHYHHYNRYSEDVSAFPEFL